MSGGPENPFKALFGSEAGLQEFLVNRRREETDHPDTDESRLIKETFRFAAKVRDGDPEGLLLLEDFETMAPDGVLSLTVAEQMLTEKLLLDDPQNNGSSRAQNEDRPVIYLFESFCRCLAFSQCPGQKDEVCQVIARHLLTCFRQPDLFPRATDLPDQLYHHVLTHANSGAVLKFIQFVVGETADAEEVDMVFRSGLDRLKEEARNCSISGISTQVLHVLDIYTTNESLGEALMRHNEVREEDRDNGAAYVDTVFGQLLSLSPLPRNEIGKYEFFTNPSRESIQAHRDTESSLHSALNHLHKQVHEVFLRLLKLSSTTRSRLLVWLADCLHANRSRSKLAYSMRLGLRVASDGFVLNLGAVLLLLCEPFAGNPPNPKMQKVSPYYWKACGTAQGLATRGVHYRYESTDTTLVPPIDEHQTDLQRLFEGLSFNFPTECFFLTHRALDIGFRAVGGRYLEVNQSLGRLQRLHADTVAQAGASSSAAQSIQENLEGGMTRYLSMKAVLFEPRSLSCLVEFCASTGTWLAQLGTESPAAFASDQREIHTISFPLPSEPSPSLQAVPEFLAENVIETLILLRRFSAGTLDEHLPLLPHFMTFILVFIGSAVRMKNPHLRAKMAECLESLLPSSEGKSLMSREFLWTKHKHVTAIAPNLLRVFVSIEVAETGATGTGQGEAVAFEQKFNYRRPMYIIMDWLWQHQVHKKVFEELAEEALKNMEGVNPPLFLRFLNLLMNDAIFLLDDALGYMSRLKTLQAERDSGAWTSLPARQRQEQENNFFHLGMLARFHNVLGKETIHTMELLAQSPTVRRMLVHEMLRERIASMLNHFLLHLVGPKKKEFKVKDLEEYQFQPKTIVVDICRIYIHLSHSPELCAAVSQDRRSYSCQLFPQAIDVLERIGRHDLVEPLLRVKQNVESSVYGRQEEEELASEAPEEFLDPIMSTLMRDPVILPTSGVTVDRHTIARHLLSDQKDPFNRMPLTMDKVEPNEALREAIRTWLEARTHRKPDTESSSM
ncbi:unnamed protein product [Darwinula stevensoni]|uniref:Ubiquitin conjugation factor E4 A n=1 Tax=Darwinula stevensoni TaxID=69355 RepID=A0A7R9FQY5_9CRUS|nr:unnamed protein product [Darwinula stevensoni]CAG0900624.1 unnamed protein product [Darwinula stevensoni]